MVDTLKELGIPLPHRLFEVTFYLTTGDHIKFIMNPTFVGLMWKDLAEEHLWANVKSSVKSDFSLIRKTEIAAITSVDIGMIDTNWPPTDKNE